MFFVGIIVGTAIGFFFKPQIEKVVVKIIRTIKDNRNGGDSNKDNL
jgi:hypothetical protein